jgi:ubiquinol-cytochrome c reductase cytochrome c1 subunit
MIMIKKLLGALALSLTCAISFASEGGYALDHAPDRMNDLASLQNGAKLFINNCLNCHSAHSMRYNRLADIGLSDDQIKKNLLFTTDKIGDLMTVVMTPADGKKWFGNAPPDLSVMARAKGTDYIYTYLRSFYRDTSKATGWNNMVFPNVAMPNALWQMQGPRSLAHTTVEEAENPDGTEHWQKTVAKYDEQGFSAITSETLKDYEGDGMDKAVFTPASTTQQAAFDNNVADLSNFLQWMSEPTQMLRKEIGVWVMLFLLIFLLVAWRLNAAYWKDVK